VSDSVISSISVPAAAGSADSNFTCLICWAVSMGRRNTYSKHAQGFRQLRIVREG
jgi:hypothetical protein